MIENLPRVSIVINSYKDLCKLESCVSAIEKIQYNNKEVIVISHGISEKAIKTSEIDSYIDKLILLDQDLGAPAQRNIGFKARDNRSKYILFVDNDVLLTESTIENLVRVLEMYPNIGIAQPLSVTSNGFVDCAGALIDSLGHSYAPFRGTRVSLFKAKADYIPVSYSTTACLVLRVSFFSKDKCFQPFDETLYFNYEDVDLSLRSWLRGIKVVCAPSAIVVHEKGRTAALRRSPRYLVYLNTRNKFITLTSVLNLKTLFTYVPLFIVFESMKAVCLLGINSLHTLSMFKAILWCLQNLRRIHIRRKFVLETAVENNMLPIVINKPCFSALISAFKAHYSPSRKLS